MAPASQLSHSGIAAARLAHLGRLWAALALLPVLAAVLAPASARADLYQWTDEQGGTVISDMPPVDPGKVSGMKLLARTGKRAAPNSAPDAQTAVNRKEQELEARIEDLERQLREQQSAPQPASVPPVADSSGNFPAPPAPDADSYGGNTVAYKQVYYPVPYYVSPPAVSVVVVPAKPLVHRRQSIRRPPNTPQPLMVSRPQFTGPTPQFTGPTPRFTGPTPQFVGPALQLPIQLTSENYRRSDFGGRPAQRGGLFRAQR